MDIHFCNRSFQDGHFILKMSSKRRLDDDPLVPALKRSKTRFEDDPLQPTFRRTRLDDDLLQPALKRAKTSNPNCAAGVIQRIKLTNFMCHDKLTHNFNPNINFITGPNGAGKSSILQALVLGLGGDSKATKRYSKLSSFVQKGSTKAVIEIMLNNEGEDTYKPEVYGRSIIFERTIRDTGQSSMVLKDANGNVKVTSKQAREEGKRALGIFNIMVDNPITVLQQDEAKEMLNVLSPDKLYQFFVRGTMISQILDQYKAGQNDIDDLTRNVNNMKKVRNEKCNELKAMKDIIDKTRDRDKEWKRLTREYAWANANEYRAKLLDIQEAVEKKQKQRSPPGEKLDSLKKEADGVRDLKIEHEVKMEDERSKFNIQEEELDTLNQQINSIKQVEKTSKAELKICDVATYKTKNEIGNLEEQIHNLLGKTLKEKEQSEREKTEQISFLRKNIDEAEKAIKVETEKRIKINEQEQNFNLIGEQLDCKNKELQIEVESLRNQINEITEMERRLGNRSLAVYGSNYARVEAEIQKSHLNREFERKPLGPVGHYVQLKAPAVPGSDLANLVESVISPVLKNYLCHSDKDRRALTKIFNNFGPGFKPKIVVSKFLPHRHKVERANVPHTLMDLLEIQEIAVFNALVDQLQIETVAVCSTQDDAKRMTTHRDNVPRNLSSAITTDLYRFLPPKGPSSYRSYYIEKRAHGLLSGSTAEALKLKHELLAQNMSKLKENECEKSKLKRQRTSEGQQKSAIITKIQDLHKNKRRDEANLQELMSKPESDISEKLVESLSFKNKYIKDLERTREEILAQKSAKELEFKTVKEARDIKANEVTNLQGKWRILDSELSKMNDQYVNKSKEIVNQEKAVKRLEVDLKNLKSKRETAIEDHKKAVALAEKMGERVEPSESKEKLNAKLELRKKEKENTSSTDLDKIESDFARLRDKYDPLCKKYDDQQIILEDLKELNSSRRDMFLLIKKRITTLVVRKFNFFTQSMAKDIGCRISLKIYALKKELHFEFKSLTGKLLKTGVASLSGGERSFAQMALICSLWEHMNPPFRCLDEWDVFLDQVNREKIHEKLYKFGLKNQGKQFVFLSPQGAKTCSDISPEDKQKVSIIEIKKS